MKTILLYLFTFILSLNLYASGIEKVTNMVPMRDGIKLATDLYAPADTTISYPVILYRTPYNKNLDVLQAAKISELLNKGYVLIAQDTRGRHGSEGIDSIFFTDGWGALQDGYDTMEWIKNQSWCNGKIGMYGHSAPGINAIRAIGAGHPNLVCAAPAMAASNFYHQTVYEGGELRKAITEFFVAYQQSPHMLPFFLSNPYYNSIWETMNFSTRTEVPSIPILFFGGWYDCFSLGTIQAYEDEYIKGGAIKPQLVMGPWTHAFGLGGTIGELNFPNHNYDYLGDVFKWFDYWLLGEQNGIADREKVQYYLMGDPDKTDEIGCEWINADVWPPQNPVMKEYFLSSSNSLKQNNESGENEIQYSYNPNSPVLTKGGNNLSLPSGPMDQTNNNNRDDVILFTSEVMTTPLRVEGYPKVSVKFSSDKTDTDLFVKILDLYPDGRSMLIAEGVQRLRFINGFREVDEQLLIPNEIVEVNLKTQPTAHVFNSGHKIQISVTSSNYPRFEVNPNSGDAPNDRTNKQIAVNKIHFGGTNISKIILPVIENTTDVDQNTNENFITEYKLENNYPNPFNGNTRIQFVLPQADYVELSIFDVTGKKVKDLVSGYKTEGSYNVYWDSKNNNGKAVSTGIYFYQLKTNNFFEVKKMLYLK